MHIRVLHLLVWGLIVGCFAHAQPVVIIVNSENSINDISSDDLRYIFTADKTVWGDGNSIQIVDWKIDGDAKGRFYTTLLRKSPSAVRRGWIQKIVSGNIYPPTVLSTEEEIIHYVATHRWAIAYITQQSIPSTVKNITLDGRTPDDPAYKLK